MGEVVQGAFPFPWRFTKRQLEQMTDERFAAVRPVAPARPNDPHDDSWWTTQYEPYRKAKAKWEAEQRRRVSLAAPHPNWESRKKRCAVDVEVEFGTKESASWGYKYPHRSRWERIHHRCGKPPVAYDGTDRRRIGYLYGACAEHVRQAMADDPSRVWIWLNGIVIDDSFDFEGELTLLTLGNLRAGA